MTTERQHPVPVNPHFTYVLLVGFVVGLMPGLTGCARVTVRRVPTPTQDTHWTDRMQKEADEIEGVRFYLPRPFLNVFESFPVRTDVYLADGVISPDGEHVFIRRLRSSSGLSSYVAGEDRAIVFPRRVVWKEALSKSAKKATESVKRTIRAESGEIIKKAEKAKDVAKKSLETGGGKDPATPSATTSPKTGINKRAVTNSNTVFAYQPMRGNFDIAYLPDFEEQYAVSSSAGLGTAEFALNLGQGWSLQGFNSLTDNSELNKRIFDIIDESVALAKKAGAAAVGGGIPALAAGATKPIKPESADVADRTEAGVPVTLRIVVVHYAARGLYPVIKPRELQQRLKVDAKYPRFGVWWDVFGFFPCPTLASEFDPDVIQKAQQEVDNETSRFTVPRYPYQYVSFNTFRYVSIEVLKTATSPFGTLYDKTGTQGDPGDRQAADLADVFREFIRQTPPSESGGKTGPQELEFGAIAKKDLKGFANDLEERLRKAAKASEALKGYDIRDVRAAAPADKAVNLTIITLWRDPETDKQLAAELKQIFEAQIENSSLYGFRLTPGKVVIVDIIEQFEKQAKAFVANLNIHLKQQGGGFQVEAAAASHKEDPGFFVMLTMNKKIPEGGEALAFLAKAMSKAVSEFYDAQGLVNRPPFNWGLKLSRE